MIDAETIRTWRINYGLDARSPAEAMRWWSGEMHGCAPAGAVAALGLCLNEIERLYAEQPSEQCKCDLRTRLVGDGCQYCNPALAAELANERREG